MGQFIRKGQGRLRCGYTTGSCAAAAAKAAVEKLLFGDLETEGCAEITLPDGQSISLPVFEAKEKPPEPPHSELGQPGCAAPPPYAEYFVVKDGGDDPDSTHGAEIHVRASFLDPSRTPSFPVSPVPPAASLPPSAFQDPLYPSLYLEGGEGVGRVRKAGLEQGIGQAAINKVPRGQIFDAVRPLLQRAACRKALLLTVSVPRGAEIARHTLNAMLGIEGGISILGTTGIVEPMSDRAIVDTMELAVRQQQSLGAERLVFVPGKYGLRYAQELLGEAASRLPLIVCANFLGEALDLAVSYHFRELLLIGNVGKLCKLAAGIMDSHSRMADGRWEIFTAHAVLAGLPREQAVLLREMPTTEEMLAKLDLWGYREAVVRSLLSEISRHVGHRLHGAAAFAVLLFSERFGYLGATAGAEKILPHFQMV